MCRIEYPARVVGPLVHARRSVHGPPKDPRSLLLQRDQGSTVYLDAQDFFEPEADSQDRVYYRVESARSAA